MNAPNKSFLISLVFLVVSLVVFLVLGLFNFEFRSLFLMVSTSKVSMLFLGAFSLLIICTTLFCRDLVNLIGCYIQRVNKMRSTGASGQDFSLTK